ncbi:Chemotaxis phosphatase CheX [Georgenia satyanarayanai]|uniref:Chemotaxis phosphatase CheX n=1 Tax=Georgenia satyanarayanai TaxID=860221 RepID=A0A2Y9A454_9MICO|nr:chemotaxis protein CheX [Georgenia satyanarayanai]PYG01042.1 chemotaxis phosphatase CheX-like protein [Georgenia satyanarayanai]SSA39281.1 Chemotaxis phosphatase CheX [Georgenia satyanarayanai]
MTATMADHVVTIAQDMFTAMIDGEPGLLTDRADDVVVLTEPVRAWVEIEGELPVRTVVATGRDTADRIARALLDMGPGEPVAVQDLRDALGEIANVIGGNLKGLMTGSNALSLPVVSLDDTQPAGDLVWERSLRWHEAPLVISVWEPDTTTDAKEDTQ